MRSTLTDLKAIDLDSFARHIDATSKWPDSVAPDTLRLVPQSILVPWGESINALRSAISGTNYPQQAITSAADIKQRVSLAVDRISQTIPRYGATLAGGLDRSPANL